MGLLIDAQLDASEKLTKKNDIDKSTNLNMLTP
jgi:hypothetical protein